MRMAAFMLSAVTLLLAVGCRGVSTAAPSLIASDVLAECAVTDVAAPRVIAWTPDLSATAISGRRNGKHILIVAYRDPKSANPNLRRWSVAETSIMKTEGTDIWIVGQEEYDHAPTRTEVVNLCRRLLWENVESRFSFAKEN